MYVGLQWKILVYNKIKVKFVNDVDVFNNFEKLSEMMVNFPILGLRFDRFSERSNVLLNQAEM